MARLSPSHFAATDRICLIALNRKLSRKFEKWCKFSSRVKEKSRKNRPAYTLRVKADQCSFKIRHGNIVYACQNALLNCFNGAVFFSDCAFEQALIS